MDKGPRRDPCFCAPSPRGRQSRAWRPLTSQLAWGGGWPFQGGQNRLSCQEGAALVLLSLRLP